VGAAVRLAVLLAVALLAGGEGSAGDGEAGRGVDMDRCVQLARSLPDFTRNMVAKGGDPEFYYFLHVPRVAGRTFDFCFLRKVFPPRDRCLNAYGGFHRRGPLDFAGRSCKLQTSHDDLSVMEQLPPNTAVFTQMRDPVDRVISGYEMAMQEATSLAMSKEKDLNPLNKTTTGEVWPWLDLVPLLAEDIKRRHREAKGDGKPKQQEEVDPYDNADVVMPLREYVKLPIVHDLVFNGETFQVLGLTNISSHWELARDIRKCVRASDHDTDQYLELTEALLGKSKSILDKLWHVGMMDDMDASISSLSATSKWDLNGRAYEYSEQVLKDIRSFTENFKDSAEQRRSDLQRMIKTLDKVIARRIKSMNEVEDNPTKATELKETVRGLKEKQKELSREADELGEALQSTTLMEEWRISAVQKFNTDEFAAENGTNVIQSYKTCSQRQREIKLSTQSHYSDWHGGQVNFTREARSKIPKEIIDYIMVGNSLDNSLATYARAIHDSVKKNHEDLGILQNLDLKESSTHDEL